MYYFTCINFFRMKVFQVWQLVEEYQLETNLLVLQLDQEDQSSSKIMCYLMRLLTLIVREFQNELFMLRVQV